MGVYYYVVWTFNTVDIVGHVVCVVEWDEYKLKIRYNIVEYKQIEGKKPA